MKMILFKLWTIYRKRSKKNLSTQREFIWTIRYKINNAHYTA